MSERRGAASRRAPRMQPGGPLPYRRGGPAPALPRMVHRRGGINGALPIVRQVDLVPHLPIYEVNLSDDPMITPLTVPSSDHALYMLGFSEMVDLATQLRARVSLLEGSREPVSSEIYHWFSPRKLRNEIGRLLNILLDVNWAFPTFNGNELYVRVPQQ